MRMRVLAMGAETLLDTYGLYHLTQLQADPELTEITEAFRQTQERLNARNEEYRDAGVVLHEDSIGMSSSVGLLMAGLR